jgi:hypothetical protein
MPSGRLSAFTVAELDALIAAMYSAMGEGEFDHESNLWREFIAEAQRRDVRVEVYGRRVV